MNGAPASVISSPPIDRFCLSHSFSPVKNEIGERSPMDLAALWRRAPKAEAELSARRLSILIGLAGDAYLR